MENKFKKVGIVILKAILIVIILYSCWNIGVRAVLKARVDKAIKSVTTEQDVDLGEVVDDTYSDNIDSEEDVEVLNDVYDEYIKVEGSVKDSLVDYLKSRLNLIPKNILSAYFNQGGTILLTDKNIAKTYYGDSSLGRIIGLHDANKNIVYMSNSEYAIDNALIHEFGHVLDSLTGWGSMEEEFKAIYTTEKDTFEVYSKDGHYKTNEREFFAEVFQESILNPKTCEASAKGAFDFVGDKIKSLKVD